MMSNPLAKLPENEPPEMLTADLAPLVLTLATWPATLRQLEIVLNFPRPLRIDYLLLAWAAVPWLWNQPWPPRWRPRWPGPLSREAPAGSRGTSTAADPPSPPRS